MTFFQKTSLWGLVVVLGMLISGRTCFSDELSGKDILLKKQESQKGFGDEVIIGQMTLLDKAGKIFAKRSFLLKTLEKTASSEEKNLIRILSPADLQGVALLSDENTSKEADQWLYLPSTKQVRRLAGKGKKGRFIGSEFTYEDLLPHQLDKYTYTRHPDEKINSQACYVIQSVPQFPNSNYKRIVSWIRQSDLARLQSYFYDQKDRLLKVALFSKHQTHGPLLQPHMIRMENKSTGRQTILNISQVKIQTGLTSEDFNPQVLDKL